MLEQRLSPKDLTILKLYFAFLGKDYYNNANPAFIALCKKFFISHKWHLCIHVVLNIAHAMDPEVSFLFSVECIEHIKVLLITLKADMPSLQHSSNPHLFDTLASVLNEAMEHAHIIPAAHPKQLEEISSKIRLHECLKISLQKLFKLSNVTH